MKVKYLGKDDSNTFETGKTYNVFSISLGKDWNKYYIDNGESNYIYPENINEFEIINNVVPNYWSFSINESGNYIIGPKEIYEMANFWENYYNDVEKYEKVINKYFDIARDELFNYIPKGITEEEKQKRKDKGWEFID